MSNSFKAWTCVVCVTALLAPGASASSIPLTFEGFADGTSVGNIYSSYGVAFVNATILTAGISLNALELPPHSGLNVATDDGGPVTITFSSPVIDFQGYFTYFEPVELVAFDASFNQIATADSLFTENYTSSGNPTNELIKVAVASGISSITITGDPGGGSFVMDDLSFDTIGSVPPVPVSAAPEPAEMWLFGAGLLAAFGARRVESMTR